MSNKNISQYNLLVDTATGDYLLLWDTSAGATYRVYVNDIIDLVTIPPNLNNVFDDIYVRRRAYISGILAGNTGSHTLVGTYASILGGDGHFVSGNNSSVGGGTTNKIAKVATDSFIGAGQLHIIDDQYDFIGAGTSNTITGNRSAIVAGSNNSIENVSRAFIGAGISNMASGTRAGIVAGSNNRVSGGNDMFIGAGIRNVISGDRSSIVGGSDNTIYTEHAVIAGGASNLVQGTHSFIGGGASNINSGNNSVVCGGDSNAVRSQFTFIGGGIGHLVKASHGVVVGGSRNNVSGSGCVILVGDRNAIRSTAVQSVVLGGTLNEAGGSRSLVGAGDSNVVTETNGVILGGTNNLNHGQNSAIINGDTNRISGNYAFVGNGVESLASGHYSVVFGRKAEAYKNGSMILADSTDVVKKDAANQDALTINFSGGAWITGGGLNARRGFNIYPTGDVPVNYTTPGRSGDFAYKDNFLYVYTGDPTDSNRGWGKIPLSTLDGSPPSLVSNDHAVVYCGPQTTSGHRFVLPYDVGGGNPYQTITFNTNSPSLTLPAGNGTYVIDAIVGIYKGSTAGNNNLTLKFRNTTDNADVANSQRNILVYNFTSVDESWYTMRSFVTTTASKVITIQGAYSGTVTDDMAAGMGVLCTGTQISYIRLR